MWFIRNISCELLTVGDVVIPGKPVKEDDPKHPPMTTPSSDARAGS